jgi:hypothetical protein
MRLLAVLFVFTVGALIPAACAEGLMSDTPDVLEVRP